MLMTKGRKVVTYSGDALSSIRASNYHQDSFMPDLLCLGLPIFYFTRQDINSQFLISFLINNPSKWRFTGERPCLKSNRVSVKLLYYTTTQEDEKSRWLRESTSKDNTMDRIIYCNYITAFSFTVLWWYFFYGLLHYRMSSH